MGGGASVSAEAELTTFKEMRSKFEALKAEGKTDEDIYAELKTFYNTTVGASSDVPAVFAAPPAADDAGKPAAAPDATPNDATVPAVEPTPPADEATVVDAAAAPTDAVPASVEAPTAEGEAPAQAAATAE